MFVGILAKPQNKMEACELGRKTALFAFRNLHIEATDCHQYLNYPLTHPSHAKKSIVKFNFSKKIKSKEKEEKGIPLIVTYYPSLDFLSNNYQGELIAYE